MLKCLKPDLSGLLTHICSKSHFFFYFFPLISFPAFLRRKLHLVCSYVPLALFAKSTYASSIRIEEIRNKEPGKNDLIVFYLCFWLISMHLHPQIKLWKQGQVWLSNLSLAHMLLFLWQVRNKLLRVSLGLSRLSASVQSLTYFCCHFWSTAH